jgi:ribosomal protein S18 acetylase RimI-like enzyme
MEKIVIHDADRADLAGLMRLETEVFASNRLSPRSFRRVIARPSAVCRVAHLDGLLAGYHLVLFRRGSTVARLYSIAVAPALRGRGVAALLMRDAEQAARGRGAQSLRLEARVDNAAAIRLYERRGYRLIGRIQGYYADGIEALRYERDLDDPEKNRATSAEEDRSPRDSRATLAYMSRLRPDLAAVAPPKPPRINSVRSIDDRARTRTFQSISGVMTALHARGRAMTVLVPSRRQRARSTRLRGRPREQGL